MPQLTVHNAEIKTATVEIKSLTVSGKQVTLAVFRQLVEASLVNEDGSFAGLPWGTVNYHPGKGCEEHGEHRHVVWQADQELRRSWVRKPNFYTWGCDEADAFLASHVLDFLCHRARYWGGKLPIKSDGKYLQTDGFVLMYLVEEAREALQAADLEKYKAEQLAKDQALPEPPRWLGESDRQAAQALVALEKAIEKLRQRCNGYGTDTEGLFNAYQIERRAEVDRRERHHARWAEICDLPQLFIAV